MHRGVIGVPHKVINEIESSYQIKKEVSYEINKLFKSGFQVNLDTAMLNMKFKKEHLNDAVDKIYQSQHC